MSRFVDAANRYIDDVLAGRIRTGQLTKLAVDRQVQDLGSARSRGWYFSSKAASRVCVVAEQMPHIEGRWATKNLELLGWQSFFLTTLFGWLSEETDYRRFLTAYLSLGKKQGKSFLSGAIGIYGCRFDGEPGAKIFSAATTRDQAREVWNVAQAAVRKSEYFQGKGLVAGQHSILHEESNSVFRPLASDDKSNDGKNAHFVLVDELWAHPDGALYTNLDEARAARRQPLLLATTTAGFDTASFAFQKHLHAVEVLKGTAEDDRFFPLIYALDSVDQWQDAEAWIMANPSLGQTVAIDVLQTQFVTAQSSNEGRTTFITKRMNFWLEGRQSWIDMEAWHTCGRRRLSLDDFRGRDCYLAADLASVSDLASVALVSPPRTDDEHTLVLCRHFLPRKTFEARIRSTIGHLWQQWAEDGWLTVSDGLATNYDAIEQEMLAMTRGLGTFVIGVDPYQAVHLGQHMEAAGIPSVEVPMKVETMSPAMKHVEALVLNCLLEHGGDPVLGWCISNLRVKHDRKGNIYPTKERDGDKIDGAVALFMAEYLALTKPQVLPTRSVYEDTLPRRPQ